MNFRKSLWLCCLYCHFLYDVPEIQWHSSWSTHKTVQFDLIILDFNIHLKHPCGTGLISRASNRQQRRRRGWRVWKGKGWTPVKAWGGVKGATGGSEARKSKCTECITECKMSHRISALLKRSIRERNKKIEIDGELKKTESNLGKHKNKL